MNVPELEPELVRHHEACFSWALTLCGWRTAEADELLQCAYLKVLEGRARFDGRSSFRTWLFGVVRLTRMEEQRRGQRFRALRDFFLGPAAAQDEVLSVESPSVTHERSERQRAVRAALMKLSPRQREVLDLVFFHDLTVEQAAEVMGVSLGSARTHYARAKDALRNLLLVDAPVEAREVLHEPA